MGGKKKLISGEGDAYQRPASINGPDNPFSDLKYQLGELTRRNYSLLQDNSSESFVDFDNDVQISNGVMTEKVMLKEVIGDDNDNDDDDDDDDDDNDDLDEDKE